MALFPIHHFRNRVPSEEWLLSGCLTGPSAVPARVQKEQYFGRFVVALS